MAGKDGRFTRPARLLVLLAAGAVAHALVWRARSSLAGVPAALAVALLAVECAGFALTGLLLFQLWPSERPSTPGQRAEQHAAQHAAQHGARPLDGPVTIVVLADGACEDDIHASLLGAREIRGEHTTLLVVREEVAPTFALAARLDAEYTVVDEADRARVLEAVRAEVETPYLLVLDAGDVVLPDVLEHVGSQFAEDQFAEGQLAEDRLVGGRVGMVQLRVERANADALVGLRDPRSASQFDNVTAAALGARGIAPWFGSGGVFRMAALDAAGGFAVGAASTEIRTIVRLHAARYRTVFCGTTPMETTAPSTLAAQLHDRRARGTRALEVLRTRENPLWCRGLPARARLAALASITRYLIGVHRAALVGVVTACVLLGQAPVQTTWTPAAINWLPAYALVGAALFVAGRGSLRFGDRARAALRAMGVDLVALGRVFTGGEEPAGPDRTAARDGGLHALTNLRVLVASMLLLDAAILARFASGVWSLGLPRFATEFDRTFVLGAAAVTFVQIAGVLQLATRRRRIRSAHRVPLDVDVRFECRLPEAHVLDMSTSGIGMLFPSAALSDVPEVGDPIGFAIDLPTLDDRVQTLSLFGEVTNTTRLRDGSWRVGFSFGDGVDRDAIVVFCRITHPSRSARIAAGTARDLVKLPAEVHRPREQRPSPRRALRGVNAFAAAALLATMTPTAAFAADPGTATITGTITVSGGGPAVHALVGTHPWGSGAPGFSAYTDADGHYSITGLDSSRPVWVEVVAPAGYAHRYYDVSWPTPATPITLGDGQDFTLDMQLQRSSTISGRVVDSSGNPIAGMWLQPPDNDSMVQTGDDGTFSIPSAIPMSGGNLSALGNADFPAVHVPLDVSEGQTIDAGTITMHRYGSVTGTVVDSRAQPIAGLDVGVDGAGSTTTASDGTFSLSPVSAGTAHLTVFGGDDYANHDDPSFTVGDGPAVTDAGTIALADSAPDGFGALHGQVHTGGPGHPAGAVTVVALQLDDGNRSVGSTATDAEGNYWLRNLPAGHPLRLQFSGLPHGYRNTVRDYTLGNREVRGDDVTVDPNGGSVHGRVTVGGTAVIGAQVTVLGNPFDVATTTDAHGDYRVSGLHAATPYVVCVSDVGAGVSPECYDHIRVSGGTPVNLSGEEDRAIDFALARYGTLTGRVVDGTGHQLVGATVALPSGFWLPSTPTTTTGSDGRFTLTQVPPSTDVPYNVTYDGYSGHQFTIASVTEGGTNDVGDLVLHPLGSVHGRVVDGHGNPVAGMSMTSNPGGRTGTTAADGTFTVDGLDAFAGEFSFMANGNGDFAPGGIEHVTVSEGPAVTELGDITIHRYGSAHGRVVDADGHPVTGITVDAGSSTRTTGADGTFAFDRVVPGAIHWHTAGTETYAATMIDGTVADGPDVTDLGDVTLHGWSHITGTVTGDGSPVAGVTVYARGTIFSATTGADGTYDLLVPAGTYTVQFGDAFDSYDPGRQWDLQYYPDRVTAPQTANVVAGVEATVTDVDAALHHTATVSGTITDSRTGNPIEGALVEVGWIRPDGTPFGNLTLTDADGHYSLGGFPSHDVYVLSGYNTARPNGMTNFYGDSELRPTWYGGIPAPIVFMGWPDPVTNGATPIHVDTSVTSSYAGRDIALLPTDGATITGRLLHQDGSRVSEAVVLLGTRDHLAHQAFDAAGMTGNDGTFVMATVPIGRVYALALDVRAGVLEWWNDAPFDPLHFDGNTDPEHYGAVPIDVAPDGQGGYTFTSGCYTASSLDLVIQFGAGNPQRLPCGSDDTTTTTTTTAPPAPPAPSDPPVLMTSSQSLGGESSALAVLENALAGTPLARMHPSSHLTGAPPATPAGVLAQLPDPLSSAASRVMVGGDHLAPRTGRHGTTRRATPPATEPTHPVQPWVFAIVAVMFGTVLGLLRIRRPRSHRA
ncbi:MAG: carboxypeptidase regulatory-like domain-containing protein [Acidimicrobiia bacterium]